MARVSKKVSTAQRETENAQHRIDRIEVFNDKRVKIRFTFEDALNSYEEK